MTDAVSGPTPAHFGIALAGIITGGDDYGSYPPEAPQKMLGSSWAVTDHDSAMRVIESMLGSDATGDALVFDRVRGVHLARAAAGATWIEQEASWALVQRGAQDVQQAMDSWEQTGAAYLRAKNAWLQSKGLDTADGTEAHVQKLSKSVWLGVPFSMPLEGDPHKAQAVATADYSSAAFAAAGGMPPTPMESAANALAQNAAQRAQREAWRTVRSYTPRFLHPLLPGYSSKPALEVYKDWLKKYLWGVIFSAVLSLVMLAIVAGILGTTALYIAWVVMTG